MALVLAHPGVNLIGCLSIGRINAGGGYQQAGDLVQSKVMRLDENDAWRLRARANFAPVVTDPGAGFKISGVA